MYLQKLLEIAKFSYGPFGAPLGPEAPGAAGVGVTPLPVLTKCRTPLLYADLYYTRIFRPKFGTPNHRV